MVPPASAFKKVKKDDKPITAILIAEIFDERFIPALDDECFASLEVCNVSIIHYALTWISRSEIEHILIVGTEKSRKFLEEIGSMWKGHFTEITPVICEGASNVGDCIRELNTRELVTGDFLLVSNPSAVVSSTLQTEIAAFRARRQESDDNVLTLIYSSTPNDYNEVVAIEKETKKLSAYFSVDGPSEVNVGKNAFMAEAELRRDLTDCEIALCSRLIATQFSDNFDFQTRDDVVREILSKDDILGLNVHVEVLARNQGSAVIRDYESLINFTELILGRWLPGLSPDEVISPTTILAYTSNIFLEDDDLPLGVLSSRNSPPAAKHHVSVGISCQVSPTTHLSNCSLGRNASIGKKNKIRHCLIGKNVKIGSGCVLDMVFVGDDVTIEDDVVLSHVVLGNKVKISSSEHENKTICSYPVPEDLQGSYLSEPCVDSANFAWTTKRGHDLWKRQPITVEEDEEAETTSQVSGASQELDCFELGCKQFYDEVYESMQRMMAMDDAQAVNLILEINSSKLACNVSMDDVAKNVFKAFISLPDQHKFEEFKSLTLRWKSMLLNYYRTSADQTRNTSQRQMDTKLKRKCQIQAMMAMEERSEIFPEYASIVPRLIHFLFNEADIFEEEPILEWAKSIPEGAILKQKMQKLVDWLEEAEDEESD